jgi:hypothetical protein
VTASTTRRICLLVVLTAVAGARRATAAPLRAEPAVEIVELAASGSGAGAIVLHNDGGAGVTVGAITAEPGCDDAQVRAAPLTGFTLAAGATRTIAITCTPAPAGMQRCGYRVRAPGGAALLALEAVCAYAGAPSLLPSAAAIDFGTVPVGRRAARTLVLHNTGGAPLARLSVATSELAGQFAVASPCNPDAHGCDAEIPVVPANGTTSVVVTCTPRSTGPHSAELHIATGAGTRLPAPIALTCSGAAATTPVLSVSPGVIDVGAVEVAGATAGVAVQVGNAGTGALQLIDVQIIDEGTGGAADWSYRALAPCEPAIPPGCTLAAGEVTELAIAFDPAAIAARDAALLINYRDTADRSLTVPLRGTGRGATLDLVGGDPVLDFGTLPLDTAAALTFQIANRGTRALGDGAIAPLPAGSPFAVTPGPGFAVPAGGVTTFTVTCRPTTAGAFTAGVQIAAPDAPGGPIDIALRCTGDPAMVLAASPPAIRLGEVRLLGEVVQRVAVASAAGATITAAELDPAHPSFAIAGVPAATPATIELSVVPQVVGDLAGRVVLTPSSGPPLAIAITGAAVSASYGVPTAASLGTFCVEQPTTPRILELISSGSATITALTPALQSTDSPFDLDLIAPLVYPAPLRPEARALVAATPKRRSLPGVVVDDLVWQTDVAGAVVERTRLAATFVDNGGAIAPAALSFPSTPIHLDTRNAQQVTLQNCDLSALQLDPPQVPAPFSIDSPGLPAVLRPGETATFSVGFHPTTAGPVSKTLVITSPQLRDRLTVALSGAGVAAGGGSGDDLGDDELDPTSFYACGGCATGDASATLALGLAALILLAPRPRRRRAARAGAPARDPLPAPARAPSAPPAGPSA